MHSTIFNLFSLGVFKVTMPTVNALKCIFGSCVWAGRRRRECFPWSGFPEMTELGLYRKRIAFWGWGGFFWKQDKLRFNPSCVYRHYLLVALSAVVVFLVISGLQKHSPDICRSLYLLLKFASHVFSCPVFAQSWQKREICELRKVAEETACQDIFSHETTVWIEMHPSL